MNVHHRTPSNTTSSSFFDQEEIEVESATNAQSNRRKSLTASRERVTSPVTFTNRFVCFQIIFEYFTFYYFIFYFSRPSSKRNSPGIMQPLNTLTGR